MIEAMVANLPRNDRSRELSLDFDGLLRMMVTRLPWNGQGS